MSKRWTYSEIKFLKENWLDMNINKIVKELDRTINAVRIKSQKLDLPNRLQNQEEITLNKFSQLLGKDNIDTYTVHKWEREGLPISEFKVVNNKFRVINLDKFIRWLKYNLHKIDISNTEDGDFNAIEPNWLKEKRKADKMAQCYKARIWTKEEDEKLISLLKEFKYGYREISVKLKRTEGAIKRRMLNLKIKERPIKADNHILWTDKEIKTVKDMYLKGYKSCVIAEFVPKSALAINGILERYDYFRGNKNG